MQIAVGPEKSHVHAYLVKPDKVTAESFSLLLPSQP